MGSLGIDIGTGSVCLAVIENGQLIYHAYRLHRGQPAETLRSLLQSLEKTGSVHVACAAVNEAAACFYPHAPKDVFADRVNALKKGARILYPQAGSVMEIGAQSSCFVTGVRPGEATAYAINGECATGTGAFFEDQMHRLGLPLEAYSECVRKAGSVPRLAGRCSVFARTDLIHRQQEGMPTEDILLGLAFAVVRNFKASVIRRLEVAKPVILAGGVVYNEGVTRAVREVFGLSEEELLCGETNAILSAVGLAQTAAERTCTFDWKHPEKPQRDPASEHPLICRETAKKLPDFDRDNLHKLHLFPQNKRIWLGVDVGSTSTNLVLIGENGEVIDYQYLRTAGNPSGAVAEGLDHWKRKYGDSFCPLGTAVTGSGRYHIAKQLGTETVLDEITAQARAAVHLMPEADTVFEIGGQDSKYICLRGGQVTDFEMNKICAAGTGSFIEEQAGHLGIELNEIGNLALTAKHPAELGERCTVLMESRISCVMAEGTEQDDICAGLCRSIVRNYCDRVVGNKPVGDHICLQGGIVHNDGIIAAFYERYGKRLHVMPYYDVTGAYGAALEAQDTRTARTEDCNANTEVYLRNHQWFLAGYDGRSTPGRRRIGIPRSLMIYKFFPMAYRYFTEMGFDVLLSKETDEEIIALSQELVQEETCYPVKLLHGHMEWLIRQGVDDIFIPRIRTIRHAVSHVKHNYGCVYMQTAPLAVAGTLNLQKRGVRLLAPLLDLDMGQPQLAQAMLQMGVQLGHTPQECKEALAKGSAAMKLCEQKSEELGSEILSSLRPDDKVLVLITRNYGISDPVLNMGIPHELLKRGYKVLSLQHLQGHSLDLSGRFPNVYWPFGQHILSGATIIRSHPNLYAVYLTNHGCGPDTMIAHLFREVMGDKPYLSIEVDEHQSAVGVITRIEAFLNSLKHDRPEIKKSQENTDINGSVNIPENNSVTINCSNLKEPVYVPPLSVYSRWLAAYLRSTGKRAEALPEFTGDDLSTGKAVSIAKESCTFAALSGQILRLAKGELTASGREIQQSVSCLIPQTEGAETEGVAPRVIQSILQKRNLTGFRLWTPWVEQLTDENDSGQIWQLLLLGDAWQLLPQETQPQAEAEVTFPLVWKKTARILQGWRYLCKADALPRIFLCGSPLLLASSFLNRGLHKRVRNHGFFPVTMSLCEYLWFWLREAGRSIPQEWDEQLEYFRNLFADIYGNQDTLNERFHHLEQRYPQITGGNIRYLCSCLEDLPSGYAGKILITPAYANFASVIEMIRDNPDYPCLHLHVDGNQEAEEIERIEIFLNGIRDRL